MTTGEIKIPNAITPKKQTYIFFVADKNFPTRAKKQIGRIDVEIDHKELTDIIDPTKKPDIITVPTPHIIYQGGTLTPVEFSPAIPGSEVSLVLDDGTEKVIGVVPPGVTKFKVPLRGMNTTALGKKNIQVKVKDPHHPEFFAESDPFEIEVQP